jgi:hypothetical protein
MKARKLLAILLVVTMMAALVGCTTTPAPVRNCCARSTRC